MKGKWDRKRIGDCCEKIVGGGTPSRVVAEYWNGDIPWVTVKDFTSYNPYTSEEYITNAGVNNCATNIIPAGTLITATRIGLGKAFVYRVNVAINQDMKALFLNTLIDTNFLRFWFQQHQKQVEAIGTGSTVKGITLDQLQAFKIFLPKDIAEQQHIADILTTCDEVIEQTENAIAKYRDIKAGMLQDLFSRGLDKNGKLRPKYQDAPNLYKDSPLGNIPKEWEIKVLGEVTDTIRNGTTQEQMSFVTKYPVSRIETIAYGEIDYNHVGFLEHPALSFEIKIGDILFSHINSLKHIGKVAIKEDCKTLFHGMNLLLIRVDESINPRFLFHTLMRLKPFFESIANSAVNKASINQTELQKTSLARPSIDEQKKIIEKILPIEKLLYNEYNINQKYRAVKQGLMKKLLTPPEGALEA